MRETPNTPKQEIKLFYCYAHEDKDLRDELQVHLAGLRRQYQLTNWYDREILPGEKWEEAIDKHLSTADVILLLISPHFVDSDYCYGKEMQRALERLRAGNCCVIPILLHPTYWEDTPLGTIQMLPTDAKPVTSWSNHYEAFHDVARGVGAAIKAMLTTRSRKTKEEWLKEGNDLYKLDRYEDALIAFEQAIHLDPNYVYAYDDKGRTLYKLDRYEDALIAFEQAIHLDPNYAYAYYNKGCTLYKLDRYEDALIAFEQVMNIEYDTILYSEAANYKGLALYELNRYEDALIAFEQAMRIDPSFNYRDAAYNRGLALYELNRYKDALEYFETAIIHCRDYDFAHDCKRKAYYGKGRTLQALGRSEEAQQAFDTAHQLSDSG